MDVVEKEETRTKLTPIAVNDDARTERRRSKSCGNVPLNRTMVVRVGANELANGRFLANMQGIKEDIHGEAKSPARENQQASGGKPRTPCFQRLYNQRHRSVISKKFYVSTFSFNT